MLAGKFSHNLFYLQFSLGMDNDQQCFVSNSLVDSGYQISSFFHCPITGDSSAWFFLSADDVPEVLDSPSNFHCEPLSTVILHCPGIRQCLSEPVGAYFVYDAANGRAIDYTRKRTLTSAGKMSFPFACGVRPEVKKWLWFDPLSGFFGFIAICCCLGVFVHHIAWLVGIVFFGMRPVVSWIHFYEYFKWGELIPGIVVSVRPTLVASEFQSHVDGKTVRQLEIKRFRIRRGSRRRTRIGDKISLAGVPKKETLWNLKKRWSYNLVPLLFATSNPRVLSETNRKIMRSEWESLTEAVSQLKPPIRAGRATINPPSNHELKIGDKATTKLQL
jgi:hypothetical protein